MKGCPTQLAENEFRRQSVYLSLNTNSLQFISTEVFAKNV